MNSSTITFTIFCLCWVTLASPKPIMVSFGTNQGPIVPRPKSSTLQPKTIVARSPAPVSEEREDVPNPNIYKPLVPRQYRNKIYAYKPHANLILGTPLDQKYTPTVQKYYNKQQYARSLGLDYTGPHIFERQDYEFEPKKSRFAGKQQYYQPVKRQDGNTNEGKYVPQIGIVYSAGVRYYVPQIYEQEQENSVYDRQDRKYYQY